MNWATIKPALEALIVAITGEKVIFRDKRRPHLPTALKRRLELQITRTVPLGVDDRSHEFIPGNPNGSQIEFEDKGLRLFTLEVRGLSLRQVDGETAQQLVENVRDRLRRQSSLAALRAVEVALIRVGNAVDVTNTRDERAMSEFVLEVFLVAAVSEKDPTLEQFIETVEITGTYN